MLDLIYVLGVIAVFTIFGLVAKGVEGACVITASNGVDAINAAIDLDPDIFMLDLGMPKLDGIRVLRALRCWTQAPILVVSGRSGAADKVEALDAGADDYPHETLFNRRASGSYPCASQAVSA